MSDERGTVRQIAFAELFPWVILVRALRIATQARMLLLSAVAVGLMMAGWWGIGSLFTGDPALAPQIAAYGHLPGRSHRSEMAEEIAEMKRGVPGMAGGEETLFAPPHLDGAPMGSPVRNPVREAWSNLSAPIRQFFAPELSVTGVAFLLLAALWVIIVWAFFGGVITRLAALQIAREEHGRMRAAVRHVRGRYLSYFAAPLYPLFGVLLFATPLALIGLIGRGGAAGLFTLSLLWPLFLVAGLVMAIFLFGLLFGWPLMWPTISAEGTDSFDALSRTYSYVYQRPLYYGFLVVLAMIFGSFAWYFVNLFAHIVTYVAAWSVSWGAGDVVISPEKLAEAAPTAAKIIAFWNAVVGVIAAGFIYSYFFSASTVLYFLLRQEVDGTEVDEVFVEDQPEKFGLPPLTPDKAGVPVVGDESGAEGGADENGNGEAAE